MTTKKLIFKNVDDIKKSNKRRVPTYRLKKPEINSWSKLPDENYFALPRTYYSSSKIMSHFGDGNSKSVFRYVEMFTPALQIGKLIHAHMLDPKELDNMDDMIEDIEKRFPGNNKKPSALEVAQKCIHSLESNYEIVDMINRSQTEVAGILQKNYYGGNTRIKCDAMNLEIGEISDVKSSSKSLEEFTKSVLDPSPSAIPYHIQAAHYVNAANKIQEILGKPEKITSFKWIYVGKKDYSCGIVECPPELLAIGTKQVEEYYRLKLKGKFQDERF